jgi:DNA-binding transcriptional MerR regulator
MSENDDFPSDATGAEYTVEAVARITRIPEDEIIIFVRAGYVSPLPSGNQADLLFDEEAVHQLRRLAFLLSEYGINRDGLRMISALMTEVERLREEVRFLREK